MLEPRQPGAVARRPPFSSLTPVMTARLLLIDDDARLTGMVGDYLRGAQLTTDHEYSIARFPLADPLTLKRLAALRSGTIEVLEPELARVATIDWARRVLEQYDAESHPGNDSSTATTRS